MRSFRTMMFGKVSDERKCLKCFTESHPIRFDQVSSIQRLPYEEDESLLVSEDTVDSVLSTEGEERESLELIILHDCRLQDETRLLESSIRDERSRRQRSSLTCGGENSREFDVARKK